MPFDTVKVLGDNGTVRRVMDVEAFLAIPLHERVALVLGRQLQFEHLGEPVARQVALRSLRERPGTES